MKALVLNSVGRGFDFEDVEIATPIGREVLVNVQASGLCTFVKVDGAWLFAERLLYVDWIEERDLS